MRFVIPLRVAFLWPSALVVLSVRITTEFREQHSTQDSQKEQRATQQSQSTSLLSRLAAKSTLFTRLDNSIRKKNDGDVKKKAVESKARTLVAKDKYCKEYVDLGNGRSLAECHLVALVDKRCSSVIISNAPEGWKDNTQCGCVPKGKECQAAVTSQHNNVYETKEAKATTVSPMHVDHFCEDYVDLGAGRDLTECQLSAMADSRCSKTIISNAPDGHDGDTQCGCVPDGQECKAAATKQGNHVYNLVEVKPKALKTVYEGHFCQPHVYQGDDRDLEECQLATQVDLRCSKYFISNAPKGHENHTQCGCIPYGEECAKVPSAFGNNVYELVD